MPRPTQMKGQTGQINQENMEVKNEEIHYYSNTWPENGWPFHKSQAHIMFKIFKLINKLGQSQLVNDLNSLMFHVVIQ